MGKTTNNVICPIESEKLPMGIWGPGILINPHLGDREAFSGKGLGLLGPTSGTLQSSADPWYPSRGELRDVVVSTWL